jgi:hypothetical protein
MNAYVDDDEESQLSSIMRFVDEQFMPDRRGSSAVCSPPVRRDLATITSPQTLGPVQVPGWIKCCQMVVASSSSVTTRIMGQPRWVLHEFEVNRQCRGGTNHKQRNACFETPRDYKCGFRAQEPGLSAD